MSKTHRERAEEMMCLDECKAFNEKYPLAERSHFSRCPAYTGTREGREWFERVVQALSQVEQDTLKRAVEAVEKAFGDTPNTCHCYSPKCVICMVFLEKKRREEDVIVAIKALKGE